MSRLRRVAVSDRYFFITSNVSRKRSFLCEADFLHLRDSIISVRQSQGFKLGAWVFLPDHWHAIIFPGYPLSISDVLKSIKLLSTRAINYDRHQTGPIWQSRFFDHVLKTVRDYWETVDYIHMNPVRRGLVEKPADWVWSSIHSFQPDGVEICLPIDLITLPLDPDFRLW